VVLGSAENLVATGTRPSPAPDGPRLPAVIFLTAGILHRIGPDRLYVRLARALAQEGALVLRLDFSGIGDSGAPAHPANIHRSEAEQRELTDCLDFLEKTEGADRFILMGLCSGGDNALLGMCRDDRVVGAVMLDPFAFRPFGYYLRYYGPRILKPAVWWRSLTGRSPFLKLLFASLMKRLRRAPRSVGAGEDVPAGEPVAAGPALVDLTRPTMEEMRKRLEQVIARSGRLLYVFTAGLEARYYYRNQFFDAFPGLDFKGQLELEYYADCDHTFTRQALQERLEERVLRWYRTHFVSTPGAEPAASSASTATSSSPPPT
jgi:pimeloyl-ACP methyl ester carboxylesterase